MNDRKSNMRRCSSSLLFIGLILWAGNVPAQENPYFPVETGSYWSYQTQGYETMEVSVLGAEVFRGVEVIRIDQFIYRGPGSYNTSYKYILDESGNMYEVGWVIPDHLYEPNTLYSPFMLRIPADIDLLPSWQDDFSSSTYFGDDFAYELQHNAVHVFEGREEVVVPAGVYQTIRISSRIDGGGPYVSWYSLGIGLVQYQESVGHIFRLTEFQTGGVSVETAQWGSLKALFR